MMELFFRKLGSGDPFIILHGLYGSGDNWYSIGRELSASYTVYLVDQRNHGNSPHSQEHNYQLLSSDLKKFMSEHKIAKAVILGHSMGGKAALSFGMEHPEMVEKMIIVDISPSDYKANEKSSEITLHTNIISALQMINTAAITSREDASGQLEPVIKSTTVRQFLLKNLKRVDGKFQWAFNLEALARNIQDIFSGVVNDDTPIAKFPLMFIKGELSDYIQKTDEETIQRYFPWCHFIVISKAGHWVHAEQPQLFLNAVNQFLNNE